MIDPTTLYLEHERRAVWIADRLAANLPWHHEDLQQAARIGLWDACRSFREGGDAKFWSYAQRRVFGATRDFLRSWHPFGRADLVDAKKSGREPKQFVSDQLGETDDEGFTQPHPNERRVEPDRSLEDAEEAAWLYSLVPGNCAWIVEGRANGKTYAKIAKRARVSESRVAQLATELASQVARRMESRGRIPPSKGRRAYCRMAAGGAA